MKRNTLYNLDRDRTERLYMMMDQVNAPPATSCKRAYEIIFPLLAGLDVEKLVAVFLTRRFRVISTEVLSVGSVQHTIVDARTILRRALLADASAIILAHNHPSGDVEPSTEDIESTRHVRAAGDLIGVTVVDHIVYADPMQFYSMAEHGLLNPNTPRKKR